MKAPQRSMQQSLIEGMARPVDHILPSVFRGTNADLMLAVAPLYLTGSVLDVTYGQGGWWKRYQPEPFGHHDKEIDGIDFRALPYTDNEWDTVCFDPPYVVSGGVSSAALADQAFQGRYGIGTRNLADSKGSVGLDALILDGLTETCRVANDCVLVKCMEFAQGAYPDFHDVPTMVTNHASSLGWVKHDQIVHYTGSGPGGHNITKVKRARRVHSYLLVFTPDRRKKAA